MSKILTIILPNEGLKKDLDVYAKARGFRGASSLAKVALNEYIRRHKPTLTTAVMREWLEGKL